MMPQKCLVTGAAGFIGSHVASELVKAGHEVICIDDLSGGFIENIPNGTTFIQNSINDSEQINMLFEKHTFDYVFHLAAYAAEGLSHFIRHYNYSNNLLGSINLINAAVKSDSVKCFVFTSSIAVYGANQLPMLEETQPNPEDPYGISKYAVELDLQSAHEMFGLNYIIFRPHNVYGPNQNIADQYRNVIGIFMNQLLKNQPMSIFGDGSQTRAFSYIDDVAPAIAHSIKNSDAYNEIFNVGADTPYSVLELAQEISKVLGKEPQISFLEQRNEVQHAYSSHEKVKEHFGEYIRNVPLVEGLETMAEWVLKQGPMEGTKFENIEILKNLPPSWARLSS